LSAQAIDRHASISLQHSVRSPERALLHCVEEDAADARAPVTIREAAVAITRDRLPRSLGQPTLHLANRPPLRDCRHHAGFLRQPCQPRLLPALRAYALLFTYVIYCLIALPQRVSESRRQRREFLAGRAEIAGYYCRRSFAILARFSLCLLFSREALLVRKMLRRRGAASLHHTLPPARLQF
jgi:hypothetical protein